MNDPWIPTLRSLVCVVSVCLLATACSRPNPPGVASPVRVVRVATVREGATEPAIVASGMAANRDDARLAFKIGGVIATVDVREGDYVHRGQRLATLEATEIDAQVAQARAAADKTARDLARGRGLYAQDVVTREQLDDLGTANALAQAQLAAVQFNRRYAEIIAPDDGRVLRRLAEPRELVSAGSPVLMVGNVGSGVVLKVGLADRDAVRVQPGDRAEVSFDAFPDKQFVARIRELSRAADPGTGTYRAELALDTTGQVQESDLFNGLIGRAHIVPGHMAPGTRSRVPIAALVEGDQRRSLLYRFDAATSTVKEMTVAVAFIDGDEAAIVEALPAGMQCITDGAAYLHDGEAVRVDALTPNANTGTAAQ